MTKRCVLALAFLVHSSLLMANTPLFLTSLEEAIEAAEKNNLGWFAAKTESESAVIRLDMHRKMFLPSVEGFANTQRKRSSYTDKSNLPPERQSETSNQVGVRLKQNLFSGLSTYNSMKASEEELNVAKQKLRANEQKLILGIIDSYSSVWFFLQKVAALKKKEGNFLKTLRSQESSLEAGVSTPPEVADASANYQKAVFERIHAETELLSAESEFEKMTGVKISRSIILPDLKIELPDTLDKLIKLALTNNSSVLAAKFQEKAALKSLNSARGHLAPSCDLSLSASRDMTKRHNLDNPDDLHDMKHRGTNCTVSLDVTIPIYSNDQHRGNTFSQIGLANQAAIKARLEAGDMVLEIKKDCTVTWNTYVSAAALIKASRIAVNSAELSSEGDLKGRALGMKSNSDLWVKENNLLESRVALANSQKQKLVAAVKLLALSGVLSIQFMREKLHKPATAKREVVSKNKF